MAKSPKSPTRPTPTLAPYISRAARSEGWRVFRAISGAFLERRYASTRRRSEEDALRVCAEVQAAAKYDRLPYAYWQAAEGVLWGVQTGRCSSDVSHFCRTATVREVCDLLASLVEAAGRSDVPGFGWMPGYLNETIRYHEGRTEAGLPRWTRLSEAECAALTAARGRPTL